jgi:ribonuclease PH
LRPVKVTRDFLPSAEGSVLFELGDTKVVCAATVDYKVPAWLRGKGQGWVTAEYSMLPRATSVRTQREAAQGRPHGRTYEIQRLIGRSLRSVVELKKIGEITITLDCDVINADGGTRTASITGAFIALHDALKHLQNKKRIEELPLNEFVAATSVGIVNGEPCLDLAFSEDCAAEVDMNIVMDGAERIIEIQGTAEKTPFSDQALSEMVGLAKAGIGRLIGIQRSLLLNGK